MVFILLMQNFIQVKRNISVQSNFISFFQLSSKFFSYFRDFISKKNLLLPLTVHSFSSTAQESNDLIIFFTHTRTHAHTHTNHVSSLCFHKD